MMQTQTLHALAQQLEDGADQGNPDFFFHHEMHPDGTMVISGDQAALRQFAAQIIRLVARPDGDAGHWRPDASISSEPGSHPLLVVKTEDRERL